VDIAPTVLEIIGVPAPATIAGVEQRPLEGISFAYTLSAPEARDRHVTQYYEMFGCRALYHEGWKAVTYHPIQASAPGLDMVGWELYQVETDLSECHDLAAEEPGKLQELVERWWVEAARHQVLPLDNRPFSSFVLERPRHPPPRHRYVYYPGAAPVPEAVAVNVRNRSHSVTAEVDVGDAGAEGVLIAQGSLLGGWVLYVKDDELRYVHNYVGLEEHRVHAPARLGPGAHTVGFRFTKTGEHRGVIALLVDSTVVGEGEIPRFTPTRFSLTGAGLTCGRDEGLPVAEDYRPEFPFAGTLRRVVVEVDGAPFVDPEAEARTAIARQ
jgi:arylsulfatase